MEEADIIILGAGAAGLIAACELASGYKVLVLEAQERVGGRVKTIEKADGFFEMGPEFIHGDAKLTRALLKEAGLSVTPSAGRMMYVANGKWFEEDGETEGWDELIKMMEKEKEDKTLSEFLQKHFNGDEYADLRHQAIMFAEGFDLADADRVSIKSLYKEWKDQGDSDERINEGYSALMNFLAEKAVAAGAEIRTGEVIRQIDWEEGDVTVYTNDETKYGASKLIITVPLAVLGLSIGPSAINITPPLHEHVHAIDDIGLGNVIKIYCLFDEQLWPEDTGFIFSGESIPTWWTQLPVRNHVLTGWAGGSRAERLRSLGEDGIRETAIHSLSVIFNRSTSEISDALVDIEVFESATETFALQAYTYSTPTSGAARKLFAGPVENTLFFAGEGFYDGPFGGTVEAALVSGRDCAKLIRSVS
ncbi:MAG: FAD-dependent oxidoreductase [Gemmatimonadaceae bacterium]|nr:FAD-dependent oxidoreductase [Chitinophagaceae bacterium]